MFKNHSLSGVLVLVLFAALGWVTSPGLIAQEESTTPDEQQPTEIAAPEDPQLEEVIVVTARRREEPLQTVPVAVTAISPEDLEERNITELENVTEITPNLKLDAVTYSSTTARVYIRGVGQDDGVVTADPGVGVYMDGVYLGRSQTVLQAINDLDRIEVLRGPQGTLYGRNTVGGAINLIPAPPQPGLGGNVMLRGGNFSHLEGRVTADLTNSDTFGARIALAALENDGFMDNAFDGSKRNSRGLVGGRLSFRWNPGEAFQGDFAVDYTDQDRKASIGECRYTGAGSLVGVANIYGFEPACKDTANDGDPFRSAADYGDTDTAQAAGYTLSLDWTGNSFGFLSLSAYRDGDSLLDLDLDTSAADYFAQTAGVEFNQLSQEFQFYGATDRIQYTTGLYYFQEEVTGTARTITLDQFPLTPVIPAVNRLNSDAVSQPDNESLAAYGQASFNVTNRLQLTGGLRYTDDTKKIDYYSLLFLTNEVAADFVQEESWDEFTGLFSLGYEFSDRVFSYLSASRGFKSGGFNGRPLPEQNGLEPFDAEYVDTFELGAKTTLGSGKVMLNGALYYSQYDDMQLTIFQTTPGGGFASVVKNAGKSTVQGAEVEFRVGTGTGLSFYGHLGLIDASYDEFFADLNGDGTETDNTYLDFKHTPPYDFSLGVQYSMQIGQSNLLSMQAEVTGRDATQATTANVVGTEMTSYELLNARVAYDFLQGKLQLAAWGRNITDEAYTTTGLSFGESLGFNLVYYAMPATYGIDLRWHF